MDTAKQGFAQGNRPVRWQGAVAAVAAVLKQADVLAELDQLQPREHTSTLQRSYLEVKPCSL